MPQRRLSFHAFYLRDIFIFIPLDDQTIQSDELHLPGVENCSALCFSYDDRLLLPSAFQTIQCLRSDKKVFLCVTRPPPVLTFRTHPVANPFPIKTLFSHIVSTSKMVLVIILAYLLLVVVSLLVSCPHCSYAALLSLTRRRFRREVEELAQC
jgi:hypothetical protein